MCRTIYAEIVDTNVQDSSQTEETSGTEPGETETETESETIALKLDTPVLSSTKTTASKVYLTWKRVSNASKYRIYRSAQKAGKYKLIKSTSDLKYTDSTVKAGKTYYYKLKAEGKDKNGASVYSGFSKSLAVKTNKKVTKTAYVGDSVMSGMDVYNIITGKGKKVIYKIGVSPKNFYNGTPMDDLLGYNPDRMYIMLGMNSLVGSPSSKAIDTQISYYKKIIKECLKKNPDMQVIVLPVSPTRPSATVKNANINKFNSKLKKMAKGLKVNYYDYRSVIKNTDGTLKASCCAGDGIHLTSAAYSSIKKKLDNYGKKLD
jgi:hypothetical protein